LELQISFTDTNAFLLEASALIQDEDYRKQKGELNHRAMFSKEQFNRQFRIVISSNDAPPPLKIINYTVVAERWWWCEKLGFYNTLQLLFGLVGKRRYLRCFPSIAIRYYMERILKKMNIER
jgi:hypothetical protein